MKMLILYIPTPKKAYKKYLYIEKRYTCKEEIVPIGCDCHPAYTLVKMNLRKYSLPFDWLDIDSLKCFKYISSNITTNFKDFLSNLKKNENGNVISEQFPYAEFVHEKDLITDKKIKNKFTRRVDRLSKILKKEIVYLCNLKGKTLNNESAVEKYFESLTELTEILKPKDRILIYIRYDNNFKENEKFYQSFLNKASILNQIHITSYLRNKETNGVWGKEEEYPILYKKLGIKIRKTFPKVTFANNVYN